MKTSVSALAILSAARARPPISIGLEGVERAEATRDDEVNDHHDDRYEGIGSGERLISGHADVLVDDVADEVRRRHEGRCDEVAERQREREDRAGHNRWEGERQDHPPE